MRSVPLPSEGTALERFGALLLPRFFIAHTRDECGY
jgi:hypothetical protein